LQQLSDLTALAYLLSAVFFILGLNGLTSPVSARRGNLFAIAGMAVAVAATMFSPDMKNYGLILLCIMVGGSIGVVIAMKIKMTAMPQLVAMLHSFVGLSAGLVALGVYLTESGSGPPDTALMVEITAGTIIGLITFTGSLVAFGKLQGILKPAPVVFRGQHIVNGLLALSAVFAGYFFAASGNLMFLLVIWIVSLALGILLIIPVGGADMPVIISMLNSYSGWAAAATGFTLHNSLLIITGSLVGFSGAILSYIMCKVMHRSIFNVVFGVSTASKKDGVVAAPTAEGKSVKTTVVEEVAFWLKDTGKVIIVPGYGMAVAQAQHAVKELMNVLEANGVTVKFAIHPVAGRMPGHMNVLLAEADIPYDHVFEMEEINPEFVTADAVLVIGANDVTNPAAKSDKSSPIYGMPILEVENAKQVFVIKRSMRPGYSGIENLLYYRDNCSLLFGDAKDVCESLKAQLKAM